MPIAVVCPQGHKLTAKDQLAGKRVKCPKCGAAVLVPELALPELGDDVVLLDPVPPRRVSANPASKPNHVQPGRDPLDDPDYALQPLAAPPSPPARQAPVAPIAPAAKPVHAAAGKQHAPKSTSVALIAILAGGGALAGVLLLVAIGWLLLAQGGDKETVVAKSNPASQPPVTGAAPLPAPQAAPPPALAPSKQDEPKSAPVPREATPWDLTRVELDPRLDGYKLAGTTWAAAYDEASGRLAVTHDEQGILVYDIDDIARGVLSPVATLATEGLPTAVCIKPLSERRVLVVAGKDQPEVTTYDLETLAAPEKIRIPENAIVDFLTGSPNPSDPFVYYSTQGTGQNERLNAERLGRIDLVKKENAGLSQQGYADVTPSLDGQRLYARPNSTADGIVGTWSEVAGLTGDPSRSPFTHWERNYSPSPVCLLDQVVAVNFGVYSHSMSAFIVRPDFAPAATFKKRPVVIGLSKSELVFGSANDYRRLASIPLPADWMREERHIDPVDFRLRHALAPNLKSAFQDIQADNQRGLGLLITGSHLVIAPLAKARLPKEASLIVRRNLPAKIRAGEAVELPLETEAADAAFEFVPNADGLHSSNEGRLRLLGAPAPVNPANVLSLAAAVNRQQKFVFVQNMGEFSGKALPLQIQIGDEVMTVTSIDDFKEALVVERTNPVAHSVTSTVTLLGKESPAPAPSLPVVKGNTFRWTPSPDQIGRHTIRMRATSGKVVHEWFWDVEVEQGASELPFYVMGIEPEPGTTRAVVWGQSSAPWLAAAPGAEPSASFLGVFDLAERRLLRHVQVAKPISAATMHATGIYAALVSFDSQVKADPQAEEARQRASRQRTPTQLLRYDPETLQPAETVEIPEHCERIEVIGGRFLAAFDRWKGETFRFTVPALSPATPAAPRYPHPIAGRIKDGWVWDGVVLDEAFRKPRLLLFPVHFENRVDGASPMIAAAGGMIVMRPAGPYVCTWFPSSSIDYGQHDLQDYPGALRCNEGQVHLFSWANTSRLRLGTTRQPDASVKLVTMSDWRPPPGVFSPNSDNVKLKYSGHVTESGGQVHVAIQGRLHSFPLRRLVKEETPFSFVERQDQFVLEAGKTVTLRYSAPGAAKYQFQLWYQRPHFADDPSAITAQSEDGTFDVALDKTTELEGWAMDAAGVNFEDRSPQAKLDRIAAYMKRIEPTFHRLTGRRPMGVPFPVYVSVIAEHPDGQQKAGLAHSYLIEVPLKEVQKAAADR